MIPYGALVLVRDSNLGLQHGWMTGEEGRVGWVFSLSNTALSGLSIERLDAFDNTWEHIAEGQILSLCWPFPFSFLKSECL